MLVASNSDRKLTGKGKLFLTNKRVVFLRDGKPEKHKGFTSVELPLHLLSGSTRQTPPEFKQPIFGELLSEVTEGHDLTQLVRGRRSRLSVTGFRCKLFRRQSGACKLVCCIGTVALLRVCSMTSTDLIQATNAPNPLAGTTRWSLTFNKGRQAASVTTTAGFELQ